MRRPTDQGTGSRFSIPPARHAAAVSEAERIDLVLRGGDTKSKSVLKSEVELASRMEERIVRTSRVTVPAGRRGANRHTATTDGEPVGDSGVTDRQVETAGQDSEGNLPLAADAEEAASG